MSSSTAPDATHAAELQINTNPPDDVLRFVLSGRLNVFSVGPVWSRARDCLREASQSKVSIDCAQIDYCDTAGVAMLLDLLHHARAGRREADIQNLAPAYANLLGEFDLDALRSKTSRPEKWGLIARLGRKTSRFAADMREQVSFIGEAAVALGYALAHPRSLRWRDALAIAEQVGVNALPIVALIAFLMGVIMAYQSALAMKQFGAEIFVADLIGLSVLRELGPLMTAILLAGRSGAAFAAEIGSMKVGDEINALSTMGLDPVQFLVTPRMLAGIVMMPLLVIFADLIGLLGGAVVMLSFHIPFVTYFGELSSVVQPNDFLGGLFKSLVFGVLVAGIGCLRGLQTGQGASSVGLAATRAVVSGIVLIVVADGIFAVLYYQLGI